MTVQFRYTYNFGGWRLWFTKDIELPCAPFFGLMVIESDKDGNELSFTINEENCLIAYWSNEKQFEVNIREYWKPGTDAENINSAIENHSIFKWKREDSTNIEEMRELMIRNYPDTIKSL